MKITIFSVGSRGDVQPVLALAGGLQHAGHQVTLVTTHNLATVSDSAMQARAAAALGARIRAENGVARAGEVIERHIVP
jgi:hypothetical protein